MENMNTGIFRLNPQIVMDGLEELISGLVFYPGENKPTLEGVRFFSDRVPLNDAFIYLVESEQMKAGMLFPSEGAFIVLGELPKDVETGRASVIVIPNQSYVITVGSPDVSGTEVKKSAIDAKTVFNMCLDIFQKHRNWSTRLLDIVLHRGTIDELCIVSYEYFGNPMFVHDSHLYILSCPIWKEGMVQWERDELTGTIAAPADLVNDFKLDSEYQDTLSTSKAEYYSADLRGHRDLYVNLRNDYGGYLGRLVIVELEKPVKEGQKLAAEFLAQLIRDILLGYGNMQGMYGRAFDKLLEKVLSGGTCSEEEMEERVHMMGWRVKDSYLCLSLYSEANAGGHFSNISICNYLESTVMGSHAFLLDGRVVLLINRRVNPDYHSVMVEVLRDYLFKAGISNEFSDLLKVQVYYKQAQIALNICLNKRDSRWYRRFSEVAADYILGNAQKDMHPEYLCDPVLPKLWEYDQVNGTELLKTLKAYVLSERNTVQASKTLYIGRSTLFYRLRAIAELTGLDGSQMAEPDRNLYLRISFYLWEHMEG